MIWPDPWEAEKNHCSIIIIVFFGCFQTCERRFKFLLIYLRIALKSKNKINQIDSPCIFSVKQIQAQSVSRAFRVTFPALMVLFLRSFMGYRVAKHVPVALR